MRHPTAPAGRIPPAVGRALRRRTLAFLAAPAIFGSVALAPTAASAQAILPLDEVRAGMTGEGRTVFAGDRIETFGVEILGVLRNPFPGRSIVLARLSGGPLEHTGVMQGMSGSPVYVDGRLVGAVAYAFPFSRDPICGITPFEEMLRFTEAPVGNPASGAADAAAGRGLAPVLRFSPEGVPSLDPPLPGGSAAPALAGAGAPAPILSPVSVSGLDPAVAGVIAPVFRQLGMEIAPGGVSVGGSLTTGGGPQDGEPAGESAGEPPAPVPGSPIGATLIGGDLVMMASGTVTHVDEATGEVFAFGHPFTGLGTLAVPMQEARVEAAVASLANSFKLTSAGRPLGVWRQDRATGVRGELGARAPLVPLELTVGGSRGARRTYRLELVDHDLLTPLLAFSGLMSALAQEERLSGPQTMRLEARLGVAGGRTLALEDVFASGASGSLQQAAALVAAPIALLLGNPLERIPVRRVEVEVSATETARTAALTRAWIESARVRPGETVTLQVATRDYRGEERVKELAVPIPASAAGQRLELLVGDSRAAAAADRAEGAGSAPRRVEQIFRVISRHRRQSRLYVRLAGTGRTAAVVGGEYLPSLPPSVRSVLSRDSSGGFTRSLSSSVLWEGHLDFDAAVSGTRRLEIEVEAR